MKTYDVICPCCGHLNKNLFLSETDGWMECEYCKSITRSEQYVKSHKVKYNNNQIQCIHLERLRA